MMHGTGWHGPNLHLGSSFLCEGSKAVSLTAPIVGDRALDEERKSRRLSLLCRLPQLDYSISQEQKNIGKN